MVNKFNHRRQRNSKFELNITFTSNFAIYFIRD